MEVEHESGQLMELEEIKKEYDPKLFTGIVKPKFRDPSTLSPEQLTDPDYQQMDSKTDLDERTRILFVDDMPICCNIFMKGLSGEYSTYWAKNREEALGQIKKGNYDLVITDYHLGDEAPEGGLDVIAESCRQGLPVISISKENHKSESLDTGAKRFVFKKEFFNNIENIIS